MQRPRMAAGAAARMGDNQLDLALVKRVQGGDNSAFDLLVRKYQHRIGAVVYRFVPDHAESQDITQEEVETVLAEFRRLAAEYGGEKGIQSVAWLYR